MLTQSSRHITLFTALSISMISCTSVRHVDFSAQGDLPYVEINATAQRRAATVTYMARQKTVSDSYRLLERKERVEQLRLAPDSTSWIMARTGESVTIATSDIHRILFSERGRTGRGVVIGALAGGAVGVIAGATSETDCGGCIEILSDGQAALLGGVLLGALGGAVGAIIGSQSGHLVEFEDDDLKQAPE